MRIKIFLASAAFISTGLCVAFAYAIPGIDKPFNPGAYYDPYAIDYEDSPSVFTLKDLAGSGYQVKDVPRKEKSVLFSDDFASVAEIFTSKTLHQILDQAGLLSAAQNDFAEKAASISDATNHLSISTDISAADKQSLFMTMNCDPAKTYDETAQAKYLENLYKEGLDAANQNISDTNTRMEAIHSVLQNSALAPGEVAARQADEEATDMYGRELARHNALLANYNAIEAAHAQKEEDKNIKETIHNQKTLTMIISDPYHPTSNESKLYTRPDPPGFYDF